MTPDEAAASPAVQAILDSFGRLSYEDKRDAMFRLLRYPRSPEDTARAMAEFEAEWGVDAAPVGNGYEDFSDEEREALIAEAFLEMDREEEKARAAKRRPPE